jgi:trehalose 6-phosphate synthase
MASGMPEAGEMEILLASNRGPTSFARDDNGTLSARPGAGGLVSALSGLPAQARSVWVCAALSDADRAAVRAAPDGRLDRVAARYGWELGQTPVRMLDIEPLTFHRAYNGIANSTLWFVHHLLFDTANRPLFDGHFRREWASYNHYNQAFAQAITEEAAKGAKVVVQDYHLTLTPQLIRERRPDLRIGHFSHTPWAPPDYFRLLPDDVAVALLEGLLSADHVGFLAKRWASAFLACCETVLGANVDHPQSLVTYAGRTTHVGVHPLGLDAEALRKRIEESDVRSRMAGLRGLVGGRRLLIRVDRTELSKNIVRGLLAYRDLLRRHPEWQGRVVHLVLAYPSRHDLPEYREYAASVQRVADDIIDEFASPDWDPLVLAVDDDLPRSLAAYRLADVAIVNPVRDGMNLVAKEVSVACDSGCALILSREAGAADELGEHALLINPFDIEGTTEAMHTALSMSLDERQRRCSQLATAASAYPPARWLSDQLDALSE